MGVTKPGPKAEATAPDDLGARQAAKNFLDNFTLPPALEAHGPAEALGAARDEIRLEVASARGITHTRFSNLADFLNSGDLLVVNDSATLPAALSGRCGDRELRVHISTPVPDSTRRLVELRRPEGLGSEQYSDSQAGDIIELPAGGLIELVISRGGEDAVKRLWEAELKLFEPLTCYLKEWGQPIRYGYVSEAWSLDYYQTIFASEPGSSEMPSAGRPFSRNLCDHLREKGIKICAVTLHTGVASLESHEPPYAEPFEVSAATSATINATRAKGGRVIAVGTTVVRSLETMCDDERRIHPGRGFTDLVVTPSTGGIRSVDGLISGWHEPKATHLMMLESMAGPALLAASYEAALDQGYRWHEFGDSHLILR